MTIQHSVFDRNMVLGILILIFKVKVTFVVSSAICAEDTQRGKISFSQTHGVKSKRLTKYAIDKNIT